MLSLFVTAIAIRLKKLELLKSQDFLISGIVDCYQVFLFCCHDETIVFMDKVLMCSVLFVIVCANATSLSAWLR